MRVFIADWRKKSRLISKTLITDGHTIVDDPHDSDVQLIDHDLETHVSRSLLDGVTDNVWMYPHGGGALVAAAWDGICPQWDELVGTMVHSWGQKAIYESYGYPTPVHIIGWTLCDVIVRTEKPAHIDKILFAPHHPPYITGGYSRITELNNRVMSRLAERAELYQITVRHIYPLKDNGIQPPTHNNVIYVEGSEDDLDTQIQMIDDADIVVTTDAGTFPHLAIARGKPTVMALSDDTSTIGANTDKTANLDLYKNALRYPFDIANYDVWDMIDEASNDVDIHQQWQDRYIGSGTIDLRCLYESLN